MCIAGVKSHVVVLRRQKCRPDCFVILTMYFRTFITKPWKWRHNPVKMELYHLICDTFYKFYIPNGSINFVPFMLLQHHVLWWMNPTCCRASYWICSAKTSVMSKMPSPVCRHCDIYAYFLMICEIMFDKYYIFVTISNKISLYSQDKIVWYNCHIQKYQANDLWI